MIYMAVGVASQFFWIFLALSPSLTSHAAKDSYRAHIFTVLPTGYQRPGIRPGLRPNHAGYRRHVPWIQWLSMGKTWENHGKIIGNRVHFGTKLEVGSGCLIFQVRLKKCPHAYFWNVSFVQSEGTPKTTSLKHRLACTSPAFRTQRS